MSKYVSPLLILVALVILALLTFMALISSSHAGTLYCGGPFDPSCAEVEYRQKLKRQARARAAARARAEHKRKHKHRAAKREATRVYGYHREDRRTDSVSCKDTVRVVGDARPNEAAARDDAEAAWMRETRWKYGALYISLPNARDYAIRCSRDSITEIVGQTMQRCELMARPCNPPFQSRDDR